MSTTAVASPPVPPRVLRFTSLERLLHWGLAIPFLVATVTGLLLGFGHEVGVTVDHYTVRRIHIIAGLLVVAVPVALVGAGLATTSRKRLRSTLAALGGRREQGLVGGSPSFRPGQQAFAGAVAAGAVLSLVSGVELWQWHWFSRDARRGALALHQALGFGFGLAILGHVYLAVIHPRTRWALPGIFTGRVAADRMPDPTPSDPTPAGTVESEA